MRVVVTGATGNVGYAVVKALVNEPRIDRVTGVARRAPRFDRSPYADAKFTWQSADVGYEDLTAVLAGADAVVHLAWRFQPTRDVTVTWRANVVGTTRVMEAAADAGVDALIYASSVGAYAPAAGFDAGHDAAGSDEPVSEDYPTIALPTAAYGVQKSYLERALDAFEGRNPVIDASALAGIFSARPLNASPRLVRQAMAAAYRMHAVPSEPGLLELFMSLAVMATRRARDVLGWSPQRTSTDALAEFVDGLAGGDGEGAPTEPLSARAS